MFVRIKREGLLMLLHNETPGVNVGGVLCVQLDGQFVHHCGFFGSEF